VHTTKGGQFESPPIRPFGRSLRAPSICPSLLALPSPCPCGPTPCGLCPDSSSRRRQKQSNGRREPARNGRQAFERARGGASAATVPNRAGSNDCREIGIAAAFERSHSNRIQCSMYAAASGIGDAIECASHALMYARLLFLCTASRALCNCQSCVVLLSVSCWLVQRCWHVRVMVS
jgi:hypothetical protein